MKHYLFTAFCLLTVLLMPAGELMSAGQSSYDPHLKEYKVLARQIQERPKWNNVRLERETLRRDALIFESDKSPIVIVLRRTQALMDHLRTMENGPKLKAEDKTLADLRNRYQSTLSEAEKKALFSDIVKLRRKIAFQNPKLDFNHILFIKHNRSVRGQYHMVDQYLGFNQEAQGGVYVLENAFSEEPSVRSLLEHPVSQGRLKGELLEDQGSFISLELDYDAEQIYFAFTEAQHKQVFVDASKMDRAERLKNGHALDGLAKNPHYLWTPERTFHIFRMNVDGSDLVQLTDGPYNDFDPCVLPNGRIVFISGRIGGNQRCGVRMCSTYTLHAMMPDGSDIIPLSYHDTNEWQPSVDNDGKLVYTRWDYVDRDSNVAHHIWHCYPDGRDPRSHHGNYPESRHSRPWMEMSARAVPDSNLYIAVAAKHHGQNYGSLVMIDISKPDDGSMSQVKRITPEVLFPEAERQPGIPLPRKDYAPANVRISYKQARENEARAGVWRPNNLLDEIYGQPWPLDEDFYLCVYNNGETTEPHGLFLVDSFGNRIHLYDDPKIGCLDPIPLKPRPSPPIIPTQTQQARADREEGEPKPAMGTVSVMNIYDSRLPWPDDTKIKELRIISLFPKSNLYMYQPAIGVAPQSLARGVLGTVPVEEDGSVYFNCPSDCAIYFQALDEKGMMVQNMRSITYLHPGENMSCMGCHKDRSAPSLGGLPLAVQRSPSDIKPEVVGSYPITFPRLVQPVLDKHCVECHDNEDGAPSLRGDEFDEEFHSAAFRSLMPFAWGKRGQNGGIILNERSYSIPGQEGARVAQLYKLLKEGHYEVELSEEEMRRITLWLDCNSNFFGAYFDAEKQARGLVVQPLLSQPRHKPFKELVQ